MRTMRCMKCKKPKTAARVITVRKLGKEKGVVMDFYQGRCPKCHSKMMSIKAIVGVKRGRR
jgi:Zn finger protein HypA/HybF involved in hydrogenase expression